MYTVARQRVQLCEGRCLLAVLCTVAVTIAISDTITFTFTFTFTILVTIALATLHFPRLHWTGLQ